jgi:YHS domain-containing protein
MKRFAAAALLCLVALVAPGCAPLVTQSPGEGLSPVNAVSEGEDKHLMLFGHDVVSYFTDHHHQLGSPQIKTVYKGVTFRFASAEHKQMFDAAPEKYIPQFNGYC